MISSSSSSVLLAPALEILTSSCRTVTEKTSTEHQQTTQQLSNHLRLVLLLAKPSILDWGWYRRMMPVAGLRKDATPPQDDVQFATPPQ
eukprot:CAMPEP_0174231242 /NCGR_PEP_ID=MMETSP0417-20130205/1813_1 /TAXON_ID=242541 /ORGANISM="Mayorella sp, Strain BSH-02190019" /LENGTH=88 /DNA_ID=CAMNT_0015309089 /DNA_START=89 /DNA_END=352 /DNA_ORIENTATION=+